jgi:hypothetical protein
MRFQRRISLRRGLVMEYNALGEGVVRIEVAASGNRRDV